MKILHFADMHLGAYVGPQCDDSERRMEHTLKCLDVIIDTAKRERPDAILIAGDIWHQAKVWSERSNVELLAAAQYIDELRLYAPVAVLYGTPNHDCKGMFRNLAFMCDNNTALREHAYFYDEPELFTFKTRSGPIQVAGLPGFDKGHFRAQFPGLSVEEENKIFTEQLAGIIQGLSAQVNRFIPSVLMAHHTVVGSVMDNGQHVFQANEVVLEASVLDNSNFDLVCLGHIHRAQLVETLNDKPIFYAGSVDSFTFNDEGNEKGFWMHYINEGQAGGEYRYVGDGYTVGSSFFKTPAREFMTVRLDDDEVRTWGTLFDDEPTEYRDKVIRVLYTCDSETEKALDKKHLEHELYVAGAYYVSEIRPEKITTEVNREHLHEKLTVWDCLGRYLEGTEIYNLRDVLIAAEPIVSKVEASQPSGGQTGLFLPLEISVHNYRSYAEEMLSFRDIYFAMVNGPNGIGKSSLFMDALSDCLYEQPREGELTGWIKNGEKSGSISFMFQLGEDKYRVTRTRQRSGKATLAFAQLKSLGAAAAYDEDFPFNWDDISCQKLADTQQKIINLLGMDADTFRSCVLIMQDQYGRFMEAKSEDRMGVLANLLGLGVYEQLEDEAKKQLTEENRDLRAEKDRISTLVEECRQQEGLVEERKTLEVNIQKTADTLSGLKREQEKAAAKVAGMDRIERDIEELTAKWTDKRNLLQEKTRKLEELFDSCQRTEKFLETEEELVMGHNELEEAKVQLAVLDSKTKLAKDKQLQLDKVATALPGLVAQRGRLKKDIQRIEFKLSDIADLHELLNLLDGVEDTLKDWEEREKKDKECSERLSVKRADKEKLLQQADFCMSQAAILENANCMDIENANCDFLKAAKEARNTLKGLAEKEKALQQDIILLMQERALEIVYERPKHEECKASADEYRNAKQLLARLEGDSKLLKVHLTQLEEIESRINQANSDKVQLEVELDKLQETIGGWLAGVSPYDRLQVRVGVLEDAEEKWRQLPAAKNYMEVVMLQIDEAKKEIALLRQEVIGTYAKLESLEKEQVESEKCRDALADIKLQISEFESQLAALNRRVGGITEKLQVLEGKKQELEESLSNELQLAKRAAGLQVLTDAFGQDGIPHQIIRDIVPELESAANEILSQMTGGRMRLEFRTERTLKSNKGKEVATLDIVIISVDRGEMPYLSYSGGQRVRAALAVSFALAMVKASRVGLQLGMLFVDEPPFLDAEGAEAYCMALESIHERYPEMRILAISHDENMKSRFPQQITIASGESGSKVIRGG